jgi:hypothetical protein
MIWKKDVLCRLKQPIEEPRNRLTLVEIRNVSGVTVNGKRLSTGLVCYVQTEWLHEMEADYGQVLDFLNE